MIEEIEDRLDNWSRQYRERMKYGCCASIEGRMYHAPWRQWALLSDIQHSSVVDWRDAEKVENAYRVMPDIYKPILKHTYMSRMPIFIICRKSHIPVWKYPDTLRKAQLIIENVLALQETIVYACENLNRASERIHPTEVDFPRPKETP